jgi:hypothetical protein
MMRKEFYINGASVILEFDPETSIQDLIKLALDKANFTESYTHEDFFAITGKDAILEKLKAFNDQYYHDLPGRRIDTENEQIYFVHRSKRHWFSRTNPYSSLFR